MTLKVDKITHPDATGDAIEISSGGDISFTGNLTTTGTLPAAALTGDIAASQLTGTLPALDGSALREPLQRLLVLTNMV